MRTLFTTAFIAAMLSAGASAEDFTGFHIGGQVGLEKGDIDLIQDGEFFTDTDAEGVGYGAFVGYDLQLADFVIGAGLDFSISNIDLDFTPLLETGGGEIDRTIGIHGRVGYVLFDKILLYGQAGYVNVTIDLNTASGTSFNDAEVEGWRAGPGIELRLVHGVFVKGEALFTGLSEIVDENSNLVAEPTLDYIRAGIGVRF